MYAPKTLPIETKIQESLRHITTLNHSCHAYFTHVEPFTRADIQAKTNDTDLLTIIAMIHRLAEVDERIKQSVKRLKEQLKQYEKLIQTKKSLLKIPGAKQDTVDVIAEHETRLLPLYRAEITSVCLATKENSEKVKELKTTTVNEIQRTIALRRINKN